MSKSVYKLYVSLKYVKPKCFRTFIIRSDCKMMTLASTLIYIFNGNASHIYSFDVPSRKLDVQIYIDEGMNESDDDFAINVRHEQPSKHVEEVSPWVLESSGLGIKENSEKFMNLNGLAARQIVVVKNLEKS